MVSKKKLCVIQCDHFNTRILHHLSLIHPFPSSLPSSHLSHFLPFSLHTFSPSCLPLSRSTCLPPVFHLFPFSSCLLPSYWISSQPLPPPPIPPYLLTGPPSSLPSPILLSFYVLSPAFQDMSDLKKYNPPPGSADLYMAASKHFQQAKLILENVPCPDPEVRNYIHYVKINNILTYTII